MLLIAERCRRYLLCCPRDCCPGGVHDNRRRQQLRTRLDPLFPLLYSSALAAPPPRPPHHIVFPTAEHGQQ